MMCWAVKKHNGPVAVRYPRGGDRGYTDSAWRNGAVMCHRQGGDVTIITYGTLLQNAMDAAQILACHGIETTVLRLLTVNPLPVDEITPLLSENRQILILEETNTGSGIREALAWELHSTVPDCRVSGIDLGSRFVTHGDVDSLYRALGLDPLYFK